jgi:1-acyl-sn-glycerol-3-phosphate acyltransferase
MTETQSRVMRWLEAKTDDHFGLEPRDFDPAHVAKIVRAMSLFFGSEHRWFRVEARGWENVPPAPALIVSNHSGGTLILDTWGFGYAWHTHFQMERPLHVLGHELLFSIPSLGRMFAKSGVLRARPVLAERVLVERRHDLLVMPGGDVDVWRPYRERYKVKFAGRRGYARTALKARVPIVPVANAGAQETLRVLSDGQWLAKSLRFPKLFRARILPIHLSLPWGLTVGPWPHIAPPTRLRYRIGRPVLPDRGWPASQEEPSQADVDAYDAKVRSAVQALLDDLARDA